MKKPPLSMRQSPVIYQRCAFFLCLGIIGLLCGVNADLIAVEQASPSVHISAAQRCVGFLTAGDSLVSAGKNADAKREFAKVVDLPDAPAHLVAEARQRIGEIEWREAGLPVENARASRLQLPPLPPVVLVLHVSPTGNDENPGTVEKPLATLEAARDRLRALRKLGQLPAGCTRVVVHGGEYHVKQTFQLTSEDSATETSPVIFTAASGESPVFSGGVRLRDFHPVADPEVLQRLPASARGKVLEFDLKSAGITNLLPLALGGFGSGRGFYTCPVNELFFNGAAMHLARGPNEGFLRLTGVAMKDGTKGYDREGSKVGKFFYNSELPDRWVDEPDLLLYGYWFWDWADSYEKVASIDAKQRLITLAEPWHKYGYSIGAPFYAINALCELDLPGEYFLDRRKLRLFFIPPADSANATIELSLFAKPMLTLDNVSNVRLERLTWELGCHDAIHVNGGSNCLFAGCVMRKFAGTGIEIKGGNQNGLLSCDLYSFGRGGISMHGGDRKNLESAGHFVENCDIHDLSRIDHTYTPAIAMGGVGIRIAHNRMHDVLSSALNVTGNDHLIEYNEVFNAVTESDDQGALDTFGNATYRGNVYRFNYWHHIGNWRAIGEQPKCGQAGVRLDDAISGTLVYGNIFERCSTGAHGFGAVQINGGRDNIVDNNLFVDCAAALTVGTWDNQHWREWVAPQMTNGEINAALYLQRYPALARLTEGAQTNSLYRNQLVRCGQLFRGSAKNIEMFDNPVLESERDTTNQPGFAHIPREEMGVYPDEFSARRPASSKSPSLFRPSQ